MLKLDPVLVDSVTGGLLCGIDVDGGPTTEQLLVLKAIVSHLWERPDLEVGSVPHVSARELANILTDENARTMFHELHLALETCRHPQSLAQVAAVQEYADALEVDGDDLEIFRDLMSSGVEAAAQDYKRFLTIDMLDRSEPSLSETKVDALHPETQLAEKLGAFSEYGPGTLGRAYLSFYERFGLSLPGIDLSLNNHFFVAHDMTHTIAGLSTTPAAEIALSAFQFAMNNNRINRAAFLASLVAHEAGFALPPHLSSGETGLLLDPPAAQLLGQELRRGSQCRKDFSLVDHFALAPLLLSDVRSEFGVGAPVDPLDGHHWW
ncbi:hypothetical protein [Ilumatobacter sp.]|jgi:hypothetical protein|uniref:hypothetical protein n=1 Tax=Ilumatobacter sp. TaxID=1967498 RepID=UPI0030A0AAFF